MKFDLGELMGPVMARATQRSYGAAPQAPTAAVPAAMVATVQALMTEVSRLRSDLNALKSAVQTLASNDQRIASAVNGFGDIVQQVDQRSMKVARALLGGAARGPARQQMVSMAKEPAIYQTPARADIGGDGSDATPGTTGIDGTQADDSVTADVDMSPEDRMFTLGDFEGEDE